MLWLNRSSPSLQVRSSSVSCVYDCQSGDCHWRSKRIARNPFLQLLNVVECAPEYALRNVRRIVLKAFGSCTTEHRHPRHRRASSASSWQLLRKSSGTPGDRYFYQCFIRSFLMRSAKLSFKIVRAHSLPHGLLYFHNSPLALS